MLVPSLLVVLALAIIAYFLKRSFEELAQTVKEAISKLGAHDTRISVVEQRLGSVEVEQERQRRSHHELRNEMQTHLFKRRSGE